METSPGRRPRGRAGVKHWFSVTRSKRWAAAEMHGLRPPVALGVCMETAGCRHLGTHGICLQDPGVWSLQRCLAQLGLKCTWTAGPDGLTLPQGAAPAPCPRAVCWAALTLPEVGLGFRARSMGPGPSSCNLA